MSSSFWSLKTKAKWNENPSSPDLNAEGSVTVCTYSWKMCPIWLFCHFLVCLICHSFLCIFFLNCSHRAVPPFQTHAQTDTDTDIEAPLVLGAQCWLIGITGMPGFNVKAASLSSWQSWKGAGSLSEAPVSLQLLSPTRVLRNALLLESSLWFWLSGDCPSEIPTNFFFFPFESHWEK